ncbi:LysR substrate-binding domain-containing protein [Rhizorhabdus dicambivorans]|uniref:LysR family transcriptional regulator n=1 Tax=Rhizorhabdus dicambivorans TaxID=1850238 RepID=A0A2A4FNN9_9SPHN|nr:LysR substrate-binding domain-containing protein [Rhizorhabdus dicambivorans]ATE66383.1 LysR family transcriptional regulator [Rhizorhabdus dicambivorans]PCE40375.1 LysR family transcriptional regulator [Rhizorhabdus dicambivorans]
MLDPSWLKSFAAVARTLSFTAAAASLNLRQSTVSEHVRKLEAAVGARLFIRDTHSVRLTADGEAMLGFAGSILDANERALRHFAKADLSGSVRLGVTEDVVLAGLPELLRRFTADHPRIALELVVELSETVREKLELGMLDLAFIKRAAGDTTGDLVWREPLVWIAAPDFVLDGKAPIPLIVLSPPAITRTAALAALENIGGSWHIVCTSGTQSGVHATVAAGLGVAPHARSLVPPGLKEVHSPDLPALGDVEFVVLAGRQGRRGPALALVEAIKTHGSLLRRRNFRN